MAGQSGFHIRDVPYTKISFEVTQASLTDILNDAIWTRKTNTSAAGNH